MTVSDGLAYPMCTYPAWPSTLDLKLYLRWAYPRWKIFQFSRISQYNAIDPKSDGCCKIFEPTIETFEFFRYPTWGTGSNWITS